MIVCVTNSLSKPQLHNLTQLFQVVVDLAVVLVRFKHERFKSNSLYNTNTIYPAGPTTDPTTVPTTMPTTVGTIQA